PASVRPQAPGPRPAGGGGWGESRGGGPPGCTVGLRAMGRRASPHAGRPMPHRAAEAAVATFVSLTRARHPEVSLLPLRRVGPNRPVVTATPRQVIWPFAAPEDLNALLDRNAGVAAPHEDRVDRAAD